LCLECSNFVGGGPAGGAYDAPSDPLVVQGEGKVFRGERKKVEIGDADWLLYTVLQYI